MTLPLSAQLEALLFFETDSMPVKKLAKLLERKESEVEEALGELEASLQGRGIALSRLDGEVMLVTAKEMAPLIERLSKEALEGDLSKASVETLSIILYQGSATKADIDYIRGVNSSFILRALQIRGLVERKTNPKDSRSFIYAPTFDLYNYLGITKKEELPDHDTLLAELARATAPDEVPPGAEPPPTQPS